MAKASEVAYELRKVAELLETEPDTEVRAPLLFFPEEWDGSGKEKFLNIARLMPRPFYKRYEGDDLQISYDTPSIKVYANIQRSKFCKLVTPAVEAVYECDPLLSDDEESLLK